MPPAPPRPPRARPSPSCASASAPPRPACCSTSARRAPPRRPPRPCCAPSPAAAMDARAFLRAKTFEMRQRQVKYEDTPYSLEPNCKESPGGLRDLQVLTWIARAAGLGRTWSELAANGLLTPFEVKQLLRHEG